MNKKGFTLIELLAVIVILAIIALIATPQILGVIETAREGAAKSAALGYIDAVEKRIMLSEVDTKNNSVSLVKAAGYEVVEKDLKNSSNTVVASVDLKGAAPKAGRVEVNASGEVVKAYINVNGYDVKYEMTTKGTYEAETVKKVDTIDTANTIYSSIVVSS